MDVESPTSYFPFWFGFVVLQVSSFDVCFSLV
jgi:hypothetical protein